MITTKRVIVGFGVGIASLAALVACPAFAATTVNVSASVGVPTNLSGVISASDQAVTVRIADLNTLSAKVNAMQNVSAGEKASISGEVKGQINGLTALQAKIDAGTDLSSTRIDAQSVFTSFRIYALVIPQGYLLVSSDRINTIGTLVTNLANKLQGRVAQATIAGGTNVSGDPKIFADITAKVLDANAHAALAANGILLLTPDNGNGTIATSNKTALIAARANIAVATGDLGAAREDIKEIIQSLDISASVSAQ